MSSPGAPSAGPSTHSRYSSVPSTPPSYSSGPSTPQIYSAGSSRNVECSNCKQLRGRISVLKATMEMHMHPEQHTLNSAALLHEMAPTIDEDEGDQTVPFLTNGFGNGAGMNLTTNGLSLNPPGNLGNLGFISFPAAENDGIPAHNVFGSNGIDTNYHPLNNTCLSTLCEARYLGVVAANKELCVLIGELRNTKLCTIS
ncbi:hypothetical protein Tco_1476192 [Tanacetum coccineum]